MESSDKKLEIGLTPPKFLVNCNFPNFPNFLTSCQISKGAVRHSYTDDKLATYTVHPHKEGETIKYDNIRCHQLVTVHGYEIHVFTYVQRGGNCFARLTNDCFFSFYL